MTFYASSGYYEVTAQDIADAINNGSFTGTAVFNGGVTFAGNVNMNGTTNVFGDLTTDTFTFIGTVRIQDTTDSSHYIQIATANLTANRTVTFPDANGTVALTSGPSGTVAYLDVVQEWTAQQTFSASVQLNAASTTIGDIGTDVLSIFAELRLYDSDASAYVKLATTLGATNRTATFPDNTGTVAELNLIQEWTAQQTFSANVQLNGGTTSLGDSSSDIISVFGQLRVYDTDASAYSKIETVLGATNRTVFLPDASGTIALIDVGQTWSGTQTFTGSVNLNGSLITLGDLSTDVISVLGEMRIYEDSATNYGEIETANLTADRTWTFPDATGTLPLLGLAQSWTADQTFSQDITVTGTATFNGPVNLGNGAADTITVNGDTTFTNDVTLGNSSGDTIIVAASGGSIAFFGGAAVGKPTITGSRGGNVALQNLLAQLAGLGLITDSTTA